MTVHLSWIWVPILVLFLGFVSAVILFCISEEDWLVGFIYALAACVAVGMAVGGAVGLVVGKLWL